MLSLALQCMLTPENFPQVRIRYLFPNIQPFFLVEIHTFDQIANSRGHTLISRTAPCCCAWNLGRARSKHDSRALAILLCVELDWVRAHNVRGVGRMGNIGTVMRTFRGERWVGIEEWETDRNEYWELCFSLFCAIWLPAVGLFSSLRSQTKHLKVFS